MTTVQPPDLSAIKKRLLDLLVESALVPAAKRESPGHGLELKNFGGDGSNRIFIRVLEKGRPICLAVAPAGCTKGELAEARSARKIGLHLHRQGIAVPAQFGWDSESGLLLVEDFGDEKLHDRLSQLKVDDHSDDGERVLELYTPVLEELVKMQVVGGKGFSADWCWDTPCYDKTLMLERESGYFLSACWQGLLGQKDVAGLREEFEDIADQAGMANDSYLLHRDFQSRNIMLPGSGIGVIDYQGARFGPLAYDLASLLIDPYAALGFELQDELVNLYLRLLEERTGVREKDFNNQYSYLALQRNLQILGAFSFLSRVRKKEFFSQFILPSVKLLRQRLDDPCLRGYGRLAGVADKALVLLQG